jgi:hypothetical protein
VTGLPVRFYWARPTTELFFRRLGKPLANLLELDLTQLVNLGYDNPDIAVDVAVTIPAYDVQLLMDNLDNSLDAIGLPIAANTGLLTLAAGLIIPDRIIVLLLLRN